MDVPGAAHEGSGRQEPDPGNRPETHDHRVVRGEAPQLVFEIGDALLNFADFFVDAGEHGAQVHREGDVGIFQDRRQSPQRGAGAGRQQNPVLPQDPPAGY
jgi:hypothetical protein